MSTNNNFSNSAAQPMCLPAYSQDLIYRLRTVAGQTIIKAPALDLEAADHIERLETQLSRQQNTSADQELISILEGALVEDLVQYHSQEWLARARAAVAKYTTPASKKGIAHELPHC